MKRVQKLLAAAVAAAIGASGLVLPASASADGYPEALTTPIPFASDLNAFGPIHTSTFITVQGQTEPLFPTFDNPEAALETFSAEYTDIIGQLADSYQLQPLGSENWQEYDSHADVYQLPEGATEDAQIRLLKFQQFFDIYENNKENEQIQQLISDSPGLSGRTRAAASAEELEQLMILLPYTSSLAYSIRSSMPSTRAVARINTNAAVNYASYWATRHNTDNYGYIWGGDCANFTSQIAEAGGYGQTGSWWHQRFPIGSGMYQHSYSDAWSFANGFANYWGIDYTSNGINSFSGQIQAGDFIADDEGRDGSWDHLGFVTQTGTYNHYPPAGYYYRDFIVAQHTSDYYAWVSSDINRWEFLGESGHKYGRIRI